MSRITPVLTIKRSQKHFLFPIPFFDNPLGALSTGVRSSHDARDAIRQRRNDLHMEGGGNAGKEKLASASENHDVMGSCEFCDGGAHHLVVDFSIFLQP